MFRFILAHLRRRRGRTVALLVGVLVATAGFTVLTGSTSTSNLVATGVVQQNFRSAYDILVRPPGTRTALEDQQGLVRPNYLSGLYGGITTAQWRQIQATDGVEVAAPIAMLGYTQSFAKKDVDMTSAVDMKASGAQVFRINRTYVTDSGLTVINDQPDYVYVTRNPIYPRILEGDLRTDEFAGGISLPTIPNCLVVILEVEPGGKKNQICEQMRGDNPPILTDVRTQIHVVRLMPDGSFEIASPLELVKSKRLTVSISWTVMLLTAAIDPASEAALISLPDAVVSGRYFTDTEKPTEDTKDEEGNHEHFVNVPMMVADHVTIDEQGSASVDAVTGAADSVRGGDLAATAARLAGLPGTSTGIRVDTTPNITLVQDRPDATAVNLAGPISAGAPAYVMQPDGSLRVVPVPYDETVWKDSGDQYVPAFSLEPGFRTLSAEPTDSQYGPSVCPGNICLNPLQVGAFDPSKIAGFSSLSAVPLGTYQTPMASGADAASRTALHDQPLLPSSSPNAYLATPPMILTTLDSIPNILDPADPRLKDPISAVRVRVSGVAGLDKFSLERIRLIAQKIEAETGLEVDITFGSSQEPKTVVLPAGQHGRPQLSLAELWSVKGVAVRVTQAIDRKSATLFGLILVVCMLFLGNAASASVRARRSELAVLACLGWPARRLFAAILGEVSTIGLLAGVVAYGISLPLSHLVGLHVSAWHATLAIPVAIGLTLLTGLVPALRAARSHPGDAVRPAVSARRRRRRGRRTHGLIGLAMRNLAHVPGRSLLGVLAMAISVAALTLISAVLYGFGGSVTGSLLGNAVTLRVRGVDTISVATTVLLGALAIADVLYINIRERASEMAALQATGWSGAAVNRLIAYEGFVMGLTGSLLGLGLGLAATDRFVGRNTQAVLTAGIGAAAAATLLTVVAALLTALLVRRLPAATLLAEE